MENTEEKLRQAVWIAHTLFQLGKTSGSTGNISFRDGKKIYMSRSGCCFGTMKEEDFCVMELDGRIIDNRKPSKEFPLHLAYYRRFPEVEAVIHTHGRYSVLWGCMSGLDEKNCIPQYTPYLQMKLGKIRLVPYEAPGSEALFRTFENCMDQEKGYLMKQHGAIVGAKSLMDAFYEIEEMEESAFIAWNLKTGGTEALILADN